ncbi:hypothetical protein C5167_033861 [Papaver somniferum]|uniref:Uncharacterized protein n=1 Tax=Papaver somniferum TaxID=3469 RepID=A0A4Y7KEE6_PAPSO|nr:hypothetical protein C5167_033861 [Papaver somniferum]
MGAEKIVNVASLAPHFLSCVKEKGIFIFISVVIIYYNLGFDVILYCEISASRVRLLSREMGSIYRKVWTGFKPSNQREEPGDACANYFEFLQQREWICGVLGSIVLT